MLLRIIAFSAAVSGRVCEKADDIELRIIAEAALPTERCVEMGESVAPGFARGLRTARHRHRLEPADPSEAEIIGDQELAAPEVPSSP